MKAGKTVNVGVVAAGTRPNVVAAHAEARIDVRTWTAVEMEWVNKEIMGLKPNVAGGVDRPPLEMS